MIGLVIDVNILKEIDQFKGIFISKFGMNVAFNELVCIYHEGREFKLEPFKRFNSFASLFSFEEFLLL